MSRYNQTQQEGVMSMNSLAKTSGFGNPLVDESECRRLAAELDLIDCMVDAERHKLRLALWDAWQHARFLAMLWRDRRRVAAQLRGGSR